MKAKVFFLLIFITVLFSACSTVTTGETNFTRDQAINKIENISNTSGELDIDSFPELDKVVDNTRYYFIKVVFPNRMSAEYYVDEKEGNIFISIGGEIDTSNPLSAESILSTEVSEETDAITEITVSENDAIKDIFESIGMTAQQIEQKFGSNFSKVSVDYDGHMDGYLYNDAGFTAAFGDKGKVAYVYCSDKIEINGARSGMDFSQIQQKLGKTSIRQTWVETPINAAYEIEYSFNGRTVVFFSRDNEGSNSIMGIR